MAQRVEMWPLDRRIPYASGDAGSAAVGIDLVQEYIVVYHNPVYISPF